LVKVAFNQSERSW